MKIKLIFSFVLTISASLVFALIVRADSLDAPLQTPPTSLRFNHQLHLNVPFVNGNDLSYLTCQSCHDLSAPNPYPKQQICGRCHSEGVSAPKGSKACQVCHEDKNYRVILTKDGLDERLWHKIRYNFNHESKNHVGLLCTNCHPDILESRASSDNNFPRRHAECGKCHNVDDGQPNSCVKCHRG
jgi:hypothetical protein